MPNIKSAKKRVKVTKIRAARNKAYKSLVKTLIKNALSCKDLESVKKAVQKIDQAVSKGIIHKNKAARNKALIMKKLSNNQ